MHATDQAIRDAEAEAPGDDRDWEIVDEVPFQAGRGYSATLGRLDGELFLAVKGSPEQVPAESRPGRQARQIIPV